MLPRVSRAVAAALARRAAAAATASSSSSSCEPIAARALSSSSSSSVVATRATAQTSSSSLWQARALATHSSSSSSFPAAATAAKAAVAASPNLWSSAPRRSFAASAAAGGKDDEKKDDAEPTDATAESTSSSSSDADQPDAADDPLNKELEEARKNAAKMAERLQYALAEAENVRQRAKREIETKSQFAVADLAKQLLDVADNLWRAEEAVPKTVRDALFGEGEGGEKGAAAAEAPAPLDAAKATALLKSLLEGMRATDRILHDLLRKQGIERYDPSGEAFDPNKHAAMFQVPDASVEPGTVAAVHRRGYTIRDRVLRAAEVGVARAP